MARFFTDKVVNDTLILEGTDAAHISKSLRMKIGDEVTVCDKNEIDHRCTIVKMENNCVFLKVIKSTHCINEPNINVTLCQAIPKSDKMDLIVQKCVELGICKIVPVETERCVSRPDAKAMNKKINRWQKIAEEAAKQSKRGKIPVIEPLLNLDKAAKISQKSDCSLVFYELNGEKIGSIIKNQPKTISMFIGPEGGFSKQEISMLSSYNIKSATLGRRILRTETAPIAALSIIMYNTGNMEI